MNCFKCELLSAGRLSNERLLDELSHWLNVMRRPQGWHYDLDEIWLIENIEAAALPTGARILDAGAGLGIMQYVLASRGYDVVSLDFGKREVPAESRGIFDVVAENQDGLRYRHSYQDTMSFQEAPTGRPLARTLSRIMSRHLYAKLRREFLHLYCSGRERRRHHGDYGRISFVRAAFHDIPYPEGSFDAVVSLSALEHADRGLLAKNLSEMARVAKPGAPVLVTTSATDQEKDVFHEKSQGWCFSSGTIKEFAPDAAEEYGNYHERERSILTSALWLSRLDPYYYLDPSGDFYQKKTTQLPYLPLALSLRKQ